MLDTTSTSSSSTSAFSCLGPSSVSGTEKQWDIGQLKEHCSAPPLPLDSLAFSNKLAEATFQAPLYSFLKVHRRLDDNGPEEVAITETHTVAKEQAVAEVKALRSQVGERLWTNTGKPLESQTVDGAIEFVKKCPVESFGLGMFNVDFTADGEILLDWDNGGVPALTILVTQDGSIVYSGVYGESQGRRRYHKGTEPWGGILSRELRQAFTRLLDGSAA